MASDELQVILYMDDGTRRIVRGTESKVRPVVDAILASGIVQPEQALTMEDTTLSNTATLVDPRVPVDPVTFKNNYGQRYYEP